MRLEDPDQNEYHPTTPSGGLSPTVNRSFFQTLSPMKEALSQSMSPMSRLSTQPPAESSRTSYSEVKQFVKERQLEACIAWLQTAALEEGVFQEVVDIARKGFPGASLQCA